MKGNRYLLPFLGWLYIATAVIQVIWMVTSSPARTSSPEGPFNLLSYMLWVWLGAALCRRKRVAAWIAILSFPVGFGLTLLGPAASALSGVLYVPWQYLAWIAATLLGGSSTAMSYSVAIIVGGYVLHLALAIPALRSLGRAAGGRKQARKQSKPVAAKKPTTKKKPEVKPKRTAPEKRGPAPAVPQRALALPREALCYEKNAFRILGLPVTASLKDIAKRANDAATLLRHGLPLDYIPLPLPGAEAITEQDVLEAYNELQQPRARVQHMALWFQLGGAYDEAAYGLLVAGELCAARAQWQALVEPGAGNAPAAGRAIHNLAVLEHATALGELRASMAPNTKHDGWDRALGFWSRACTEGVCWEQIEKRAAELGVTTGFVRHQRSGMPALILGVHMGIVREAIKVRNDEVADHHLKLVRRSGLLADAHTVGVLLEPQRQGLSECQRRVGEGANGGGCADAIANATSAMKIANALGGTDRIAPEVYNLIEAVRLRVADVISSSRDAVNRLDVQLAGGANRAIGEYNTTNDRAVLRRGLDLLQAARNRVPALEAAASDAVAQIKRAQANLEGVNQLVGNPDLHSRIERTLKRASEAIEYCTSVAASRRAWIDNNLTAGRTHL